MTTERKEIAQKYVHDMINSFVEDPQGADYDGDFDPPYVSFYSPDIERLLEKACHDDKYTVKHEEVGGLAEFHDFDNNIYDIDGHRVWTISGTVHIDIDGVAFDQLDLDSWLGLAKHTKTNKFHVGDVSRPRDAFGIPYVRLPTKPK